MDQNEIRLIAHFKVLFGKESGQKIDLLRFTGDNGYAKQVLEIAIRSENEELLVVAMDLMQRRGLLAQPKKPAEPAPENKTDDIDQKYVGRLR
jgi:hypothetical protein